MPIDSRELRKHAQAHIQKSLFNKQETANTELKEIGDLIAARTGAKLLMGKKKGLASALRKLRKDYRISGQGWVPDEKKPETIEGDWFEVKDLVRCTFLANDFNHTNRIGAEIESYCSGREVGTKANPFKAPTDPFKSSTEKQLSLIKRFQFVPTNPKNPCGYSGWNFVVRLRCGIPGEIQVNTAEVLYGKGPREDFLDAFGPQLWHRVRTLYQIESSLHHGLYEIWRKEESTTNGKRAASLSMAYLNYLRGDPNPIKARSLQQELTAFKEKNRHAADEDGHLIFHWDDPAALWGQLVDPTRRSGWSFSRR